MPPKQLIQTIEFTSSGSKRMRVARTVPENGEPVGQDVWMHCYSVFKEDAEDNTEYRAKTYTSPDGFGADHEIADRYIDFRSAVKEISGKDRSSTKWRAASRALWTAHFGLASRATKASHLKPAKSRKRKCAASDEEDGPAPSGKRARVKTGTKPSAEPKPMEPHEQQPEQHVVDHTATMELWYDLDRNPTDDEVEDMRRVIQEKKNLHPRDMPSAELLLHTRQAYIDMQLTKFPDNNPVQMWQDPEWKKWKNSVSPIDDSSSNQDIRVQDWFVRRKDERWSAYLDRLDEGWSMEEAFAEFARIKEVLGVK